MIRKSDTDQGYIVICDYCPLSIQIPKPTFKEVVKTLINLGWQIRQEVERTESGIGPPFWKNYCPECAPIEGILIN